MSLFTPFLPAETRPAPTIQGLEEEVTVLRAEVENLRALLAEARAGKKA